MTKKFCTKCGREIFAIGREVICPACKQAAAEESKKAAVLKAKRASWTGESVPVRISGRASTVIRKYGTSNGLSFAAALDDLLKASSFFKSTGTKWEDVEPYKSHRRDKHATESTTETAQASKQEVKQEEVKQATGKPQEVKQAAKTSTSKQTAKKAIKTAAGKAGKGGKA